MQSMALMRERGGQDQQAAPTGVSLSVQGLEVALGGKQILCSVDLDASPGEMVALLGPSGCGKSTLLRSVAGFVRPSRGSIRLGDKEMIDVPVHKRRIGLMFQSYALFANLTVLDNVAYGLREGGMSRSAARAAAEYYVEMVHMGEKAASKPKALSGGQQQRVALARALAIKPRLLLLDEPLSHLDANLRKSVGEELRRVQRQSGTTAVIVTHDREEAFGLADRVAVLREGVISQIGTPQDVYSRPADLFVAGFSGEANLLQAEVVGRGVGGHTEVRIGAAACTAAGCTLPVGSVANVMIRPEDLLLAQEQKVSLDNRVTCLVEDIFYYGGSSVVMLRWGGVSLRARVQGSDLCGRLHVGREYDFGWHAASAVVVPSGAER